MSCTLELSLAILIVWNRRSPSDIPEPQPIIVTEYKIAYYTGPHCQREIVATDAGCPKESIFGNNTIAHAALLKYEDRLPHREIQNAVVGNILDLTRRAADAVQPAYVDETEVIVQGKKYWFHHTIRDFYCDPEEWDMLVLMEVLTRRFRG